MSANRKWLLIGLAAVVGVAALGGVGGYAYWRQTPSYALYKAAEAVRERDREQFYAYVDVDAVLKDAVDVLIDHFIKRSTRGADAWGKLQRQLANGMSGQLKRQVAGAWKSKLDAHFKAPAGEAAETDKGAQLLQQLFRDVELVGVERRGAVAIASARLDPKPDSTGDELILKLRLRRGEGWMYRVVAIENLQEVIREVAGSAS